MLWKPAASFTCGDIPGNSKRPACGGPWRIFCGGFPTTAACRSERIQACWTRYAMRHLNTEVSVWFPLLAGDRLARLRSRPTHPLVVQHGNYGERSRHPEAAPRTDD